MATYKLLILFADSYSDFQSQFDEWAEMPEKVDLLVYKDGTAEDLYAPKRLESIVNFVENYNKEEVDYDVVTREETFESATDLFYFKKGLETANLQSDQNLFVFVCKVD